MSLRLGGRRLSSLLPRKGAKPGAREQLYSDSVVRYFMLTMIMLN